MQQQNEKKKLESRAEERQEQLAETDTAASDLYPTPPRKQTGTLLDLWSASPAGWPLLPLNGAAERERTYHHHHFLAPNRYG